MDLFLAKHTYITFAISLQKLRVGASIGLLRNINLPLQMKVLHLFSSYHQITPSDSRVCSFPSKYVTTYAITISKAQDQTIKASEEEITFAVNEALKVGYRHIDTAPVYLNEKAIGNVLSKWISSGKVKRSDLFITTKLPPPGADRLDLVELTLRNSLADLQLDYVDLYLIHTPFTVMLQENGDLKRYEDGTIEVDPSTDHVAVWKEMEGLVAKGLAKSIGISNFKEQQIDRIRQNCTIQPAVLQIEYHIYLQQPHLIEYCKAANIVVTAYSPLGSKGVSGLNKMAGVERELPDLLEVPIVKEIAQKYNKSEAQVLLRWIVQKGIAVIPKSTNAKRMRENKDIFDFKLNGDEVEQLNGLDANVRVVNFSFFRGVEKHPEFPF